MTSPAIMDKGSGSTNELEEETVSVAADRSVSLQLTASEGPGTADAAGGASVTVLPPEPVHFIHAVQGLNVRQT
jgi:hypothetical protein